MLKPKHNHCMREKSINPRETRPQSALIRHLLAALALLLAPSLLWSQATTNASMTGIVRDDIGEPLPGATIQAVHLPSGTQYGVVTQPNGRYTIPAMRVGGPYKVTVSFIGFETRELEGITLRLGEAFVQDFTLGETALDLLEVEIVNVRGALMSGQRTGASTNISKDAINSLPTISRSVTDFTRLTPQGSGTSFAGQDPKAINFSLDGTIFNNAFGLSGVIPGTQTNSSPISMDAIEEIQVNIAPYDVTQGGFTGAGINAITRSGDNEMRGSVFFNTRNEGFLGSDARGTPVISDDFTVSQYGFRLGGPIIKNKLFFFVNGEFERRNDPLTPFIANAPGRTGNNVTRVEKADLDELRGFLIDRFGYDPGRYEGFNVGTRSDKFLAKLDYNINSSNRLSFRFNMLESELERPTARTSFGFGPRHNSLFALNFENSNYAQRNDLYSGILELNSIISAKFSNNLILGYIAQRNFRTFPGGPFPTVDILQDGRTYTTFGTDILTPNNRLNTDTWQAQNNFTAFLNNHTITAGVSFEYFDFAYTFTPTYFGHYVYDSLDDFFRDVNGETVELRRFQRSFAGLGGETAPVARTQAGIASAYLQDQLQIGDRLNVTAGIRLDVPFYPITGERNTEAEKLDLRQPDGSPFNARTDLLPKPQFMWSPRLGFNWDIIGDRSFQLRGGTGLFTGRPIYVNISNQVNFNGLLLGQIREDFTTNFPFDPNVNAYIPEVTGGPAETYNLALIDPNFRNPQVWRSNIAIDKLLPGGIVSTIEGIYTQQVNDLLFYESNLRAPSRTLAGPDNRPIYGFTDEANRLNPNITEATVMTNTDKGFSYSLTWQLQKSFENGLFAMVAYNYGVAKNILDGNTQHFLSYENMHSVRGNNFPALGFSLDDQRHRFISSLSYRKEYAKNFASQISIFYELGNQGVFSYLYAGDANGDQVANNDLLYVPTAAELQQMKFEVLPFNGGVYSQEEQRAIFEAFIQQDPYLSNRRGQYAERHGVQLPIVGRLDLSFVQEFFVNVGGKRNTLQLRADVFNFTNMVNNRWGVGQIYVNDTPISVRSIDPNTMEPTYRLNPSGGTLPTNTFRRTANIGDVWQMQLGLRYIFN
jgi:hypothetical protein